MCVIMSVSDPCVVCVITVPLLIYGRLFDREAPILIILVYQVQCCACVELLPHSRRLLPRVNVVDLGPLGL